MIKSYAPSSPLLKKYIECFYIFEGKENTSIEYIAFPTFNTGLSFFRGARVSRKDWEIEMREGKETDQSVEILGKYTRPLLVRYVGKLNEISIVFKPLGINHFLQDNYLTVAPKFTQEFKHPTWQNFIRELSFSSEDLARLELFLLSQLSHATTFDNIEISVDLLKNSGQNLTIEEIAQKIGLTQKTFERHFKKHLGCSPIEYKRICKFRNAIDEKLRKDQALSLTEITYLLGYTDQSYLIKEFQKLAHHRPKDFFKSVSQVDGDKIIWEIL